VLADLEYLTRFGELRTAGREGEIWLGPAAPSDVVDRFRAAGLTILGERRLDDELAAAARRPSAAGVRFLLVVAVLGLGLGAAGVIVAAGVEPARPGPTQLRSLRRAGLTRRHTRAPRSSATSGWSASRPRSAGRPPPSSGAHRPTGCPLSMFLNRPERRRRTASQGSCPAWSRPGPGPPRRRAA
jgi:hypothetical protein